MPIVGKCGHCGKSLDQGRKTCGATFAVCNKCKMPLHPHCMGEHRLAHNRQEYWAKEAVKGEEQETRLTKRTPISILAKIFHFIKGIVE